MWMIWLYYETKKNSNWKRLGNSGIQRTLSWALDTDDPCILVASQLYMPSWIRFWRFLIFRTFEYISIPSVPEVMSRAFLYHTYDARGLAIPSQRHVMSLFSSTIRSFSGYIKEGFAANSKKHKKIPLTIVCIVSFSKSFSTNQM